MIPHWAIKYIGIPYKLGESSFEVVDCYGLLRLIYLTEKQIELPEVPGLVNNMLPTATREFLEKTAPFWKQVDCPKEGDVVAMSQQKVIHHLGVWTDANGGRILHADKAPVVAETLKHIRLKGYKRVIFYTYQYGIHH